MSKGKTIRQFHADQRAKALTDIRGATWLAATHHGVTTSNGKCKVYDKNSSMFMIVDGVPFRQGQAVAQLVAASPDMLEALEYLYKQGMTADAWRHVEPHEHAKIQSYLLKTILKACEVKCG